MMVYFDCIEQIKKDTLKQLTYLDKLELAKTDFEKLMKVSENSLHSASDLYLHNRELILSLYDMAPSFPQRMYSTECESFNISVDALMEFDFPVYRISMPFFIPNKRSKAVGYKSAMTEAVFSAVQRFCKFNKVRPIETATVFFVSYYQGRIHLNVDNDNKESSVILNGMLPFLLWDDRPTSCNSVYYAKEFSNSGAKTEIYVVDSENEIEVFQYIKSK